MKLSISEWISELTPTSTWEQIWPHVSHSNSPQTQTPALLITAYRPEIRRINVVFGSATSLLTLMSVGWIVCRLDGCWLVCVLVVPSSVEIYSFGALVIITYTPKDNHPIIIRNPNNLPSVKSASACFASSCFLDLVKKCKIHLFGRIILCFCLYLQNHLYNWY